MRRALIETARGLFAGKGYAETSTPDIVAAAGVTRGALYHHFEDKKALFRAVVEQEAQAVARAIEQVQQKCEAVLRPDLRTNKVTGSFRDSHKSGNAREAASSPLTDARTSLLSGADAYFDAMAAEGRTRLLLMDGPAVLGPTVIRDIDAVSAQATLRDGLAALMPEGAPLDPLTDLVSAAFDRAAIAISEGGDRSAYAASIALLIDGLAQNT